MAKKDLIKMDGHFVESDYENALICYLEATDWQYMYGDGMPRENRREVVYVDDLVQFLRDANPDLDNDEVQQIADKVRLAGADSDFATLHKVYRWMVDGIGFTTRHVPCI